MADINLVVGAPNPKFATINLLDNITGGLIPAVFSNLSVANDHPEFATIEPNSSSPNNSVKAIGISPGTGTAVISVDCSYTDSGDNQPKSERMSITKTFEVVGTPHGAHLHIAFV